MGDVKYYAISVTYDGREFCGSQLQQNGRTVQGVLEDALKELLGQETRVKAAGRTDSGVSAKKQVFTFESNKGLSLDNIVRGLNSYLPQDAAVNKATEVEKGFSARYDATSRTYIYSIINSSVRAVLGREAAYWTRSPLDITLMERAACMLIGEHDFASFTSGKKEDDKSTMRVINRAEVKREGEKITLTFEGNSFLAHQVRNMAGALVQVGSGELSLEQFKNIMGKKQPGSFLCLPPHGLVLESTNYPTEHGI